MRENAAAMDKLIAETKKTPPQNMTAVADLQMYQKFAQAHVDGLKNMLSHFGPALASVFGKRYAGPKRQRPAAMPAAYVGRFLEFLQLASRRRRGRCC
jgi:hypothetical protein